MTADPAPPAAAQRPAWVYDGERSRPSGRTHGGRELARVPHAAHTEMTTLPAADGRQIVVLLAQVSAALARGDGVDATLQGCAEGLVHSLGAAFARIWLCEPG